MLNAVRYGKAGRAEIDGKAVGWRELYSTSEDLLTASVFERLSYLPSRRFTSVIAKLFRLELPFLHDPYIQNLEYWPSLRSDDDTRRFVEPDMICEIVDGSGDFDIHLIIEVKPYAHATPQSVKQWNDQISAMFHTFAENGVAINNLAFCALGGLGHDIEGRVRSMKAELEAQYGGSVSFHGADWMTLRREVRKLTSYPDCPDALIDDILQSLDLAGHREWTLFDSLELVPNARFLDAMERLDYAE